MLLDESIKTHASAGGCIAFAWQLWSSYADWWRHFLNRLILTIFGPLVLETDCCLTGLIDDIKIKSQ